MYDEGVTEKSVYEGGRMMLPHLLALSLAFLLDRLIGDPPSWPHPVKWMGAYIARLDRLLNHGQAKKRKGLLMMSSLLLIDRKSVV